MQIEDLRISRLEIPFKVKFRHASAERSRMQSIWVEARRNGLTGVGEGCPREYVTGESFDSAEEFFRNTRDRVIADVHSIDDLRAWQSAHTSEIDTNPSAWCAIELALLDLFARDQQVTVESLLGLPHLRDMFFYSAVLGDGTFRSFLKTALKYRAFGFTSFKVKLSGNLAVDRKKLETLRILGLKSDRIRVDANNLWKDHDDVNEYLTALGRIGAVEEPVAAGDYDGMRRIAKETGTSIILDESMLRMEQLREITEDPQHWIINIRVSKMGGLLRSLELAKQARSRSIRIIVGAQVGETSVLTRAALLVAQAAGEALYAQEGAFGTRLLSEDVCASPVMFGFGGRLKPSTFGLRPEVGWGVSTHVPPSTKESLGNSKYSDL